VPNGEFRVHRLFWIAAFAFALHNAEEAFGITSLYPEPLRTALEPVSASGVQRALVVVTVLPVALALSVSRGVPGHWSLWLLLLLQATLAINAVAHVVFAFLAEGHAPGVVTAVLLNLPLAFYILRRAWKEGWVSASALWALLPAALFVHGPLLAGLPFITGAVQPR